jgi:hypothetical protein
MKTQTSSETQLRKRIDKAIDTFLSQRRTTDGSHYAPVYDADMVDLDRILSLLIGAKWEADVDGDYPLEYRLLDRTKHSPEFWMYVPRHDKIVTPEQYRSALRAATSNVNWANQALGYLVNQITEGADILSKKKCGDKS